MTALPPSTSSALTTRFVTSPKTKKIWSGTRHHDTPLVTSQQLLNVQCARADGVATQTHRGGADGEAAQNTQRNPHNVRSRAPAGPDDLQHGVRSGRLALDLDGQDAEQQDLDCRAGCIPEGAADAVFVGDIAALQERGGPGPLQCTDPCTESCGLAPAQLPNQGDGGQSLHATQCPPQLSPCGWCGPLQSKQTHW